MKSATVVIVLQARMGSVRLPGKALKPIAGLPLIGHCITRLQSAAAGPVVLATTTGKEDDPLAREGERLGALVVRGSTDDVLARFVQAAALTAADLIVRATGDNPAVDPGSVVRLVEIMSRRPYDYAVEEGLPYGCTVEVVTSAALHAAAVRAKDPGDREHVTTFIRRRADRFRCAIVPAPSALCRSDLRFTVDTPKDLGYMQRLIEYADGRRTGLAPLARLISMADCLASDEEVA